MLKGLFGTDGVRGRANSYPMDAETVLKLGMVIGTEARKAGNKIVVGKDTRISGYMLESALVSGLTSVGVHVGLVGPMPTAAVAMLTKSLRASMGIVLSASHNPYFDNGIKVFDGEGYKLSSSAEETIESKMYSQSCYDLAPVDDMGKVYRISGAYGRYMEYVKSTFPKNLKLTGIKVVVDCANGAAYNIGGEVFWELGADVVVMFNKPNGFNINENCGSLHPESMVRKVVEVGADIGIALDGDADRVALCDEKGTLIDGDKVIATIMKHWHASKLINSAVVSMVSSKSLDDYAKGLGVRLYRCAIGDRNVSYAMREHSCVVGGERSGHIILSEYSTTGDGLIAALQVLSIMLQENKRASAIFDDFTPMPRIHKDVACAEGFDEDSQHIKSALRDAEKVLAEVNGRVMIRKSGTEKLIRLLVEGESLSLVERVSEELCKKLQ